MADACYSSTSGSSTSGLPRQFATVVIQSKSIHPWQRARRLRRTVITTSTTEQGTPELLVLQSLCERASVWLTLHVNSAEHVGILISTSRVSEWNFHGYEVWMNMTETFFENCLKAQWEKRHIIRLIPSYDLSMCMFTMCAVMWRKKVGKHPVPTLIKDECSTA